MGSIKKGQALQVAYRHSGSAKLSSNKIEPLGKIVEAKFVLRFHVSDP
jgi:hypothetical protein